MAELDDILQRLAPTLGRPAGVPEPLDGGITNRNFRATLGGSEYVIRLPGKDTELLGIVREAERRANDAAAGLGIAPAVAAALEECLVTRFVTCRPLAQGEIAAAAEEIALALRSFHESPTHLPASFSVPRLLADYAMIVERRGGRAPDGYAELVAVAARIAVAIAGADLRPCHNDLLPGNLIRAQGDGRMMIVDWEYAGMGDPRFDLGNLSVNNHFDHADDERLLSAYYGESPTDNRRAALVLMRVMSDAREAAWGVVQAEISELDFDFEGYAREHMERLHAAAEQPDFEECLATAAG
ncbi:MAG: phosphotransferase [Solirubrobacterales bacterium]|nr:phosphotransferase [Solirubrobacterales bacterium]